MKYKNLRTASKTLSITGMMAIVFGVVLGALTNNYLLTLIGYSVLSIGGYVENARLHCVIEELERENHSSRSSSNSSEI